MTSILQPDAETVERTIEGTILENFVHVFGSDSTDESGRGWLPDRESLSFGAGGSGSRGLNGPFLLVDLGAFLESIRGTARSSDVGETAAEIAGERGTDDEGSSGRGTLTKVLLVGAALGAAYAASSRLRSVDEPTDEAENIAQKAASTIQQRGELAADRIEEGSQSLADRIEEGADRTTDTVDVASETAEDVKEDASDTAGDVREEVSGTAEDV